MRKIFLLTLSLFFLSSPAFAWPTFSFDSFTGLSDTPNDYTGESGNCTAVNGTETALEFVTCGSGGGGDSITVNSSAASNANFLDNVYIDWNLNTATSPDDINSKFNYAETLAGNPALLVDECIFVKLATGGGFLCEGSTADTSEQLYLFPDLNGSDTTEYIVIADDANVSAAEAGYLDGVTSAIQTQLDAKEVQLDDEAGLYAVLSDVTNFLQTGDALDADDVTGDTSDDDDLDVAAGGTGVSTLTDGGVLLGSGTGDVTATAVLANGELLIGDGTTDPTLATLTGTANEIEITNGAGSITIGLLDPLIVGKGGTGATTLTDGGILLGSGTGAITALGVATNGQIPIGDGTTDPQLAAITGDDGITITNGAGTIEVDVTPLASGSDADSSTAQSDSGLEIVSNELTLLRGCSDNQILKWDETQDDWNCEADGGGGGTAFNEVNLPIQSAKITGSFVTDGDATQGAGIDGGDGNWRLLFDATTDEAAVWQFKMPNNYSSTPVLEILYSMTSATTLEVEFEGAIMCVSDGDAADVGTASFSTIAVGSATVPGTAGHPDKINITLTDDSCAADDMVWVYLSTDADDATNDDATGDREVLGATLSYTAA